MSVELFLSILLISTLLTIFLTELLKKLLIATETPYRSNAVVLDSAMVCATLTAMVFKTVLNLGLTLSLEQIVRLLLVILSTWLASMYIYDKGRQTLKQYRRFKNQIGVLRKTQHKVENKTLKVSDNQTKLHNTK